MRVVSSRCLALLPLLLLVAPLKADEPKDADKRLSLHYRARVASPGKSDYDTVAKIHASAPTETAIIVCDMWDTHHCYNAVKRVEELVPRMNKVLENARGRGVLIIHAPSSCMAAYVDNPARLRAQAAPTAKNLPKGIDVWCNKIPSEEKGTYPIDQSDGGSDSDPAEEQKHQDALAKRGRDPKAPWKTQHPGLKIDTQKDAISDSGVEIWNLLEQRGIDTVIVLGVHTNMCVLGRPFGLRQLVKNGRAHVFLMRDMTDTMYNPKMRPQVNHFQGTELIIEHVEKYVCPTITSVDFLGGAPFRFKGDSRQ